MTARTDWQGVHGANYIPSYSRSALETWRRFDTEVLDRELGFAQGLGLNSVRVTLSYRLYLDDPALMSARFEEFLSLCDAHELTALPILFEGCGVDEKDLAEKGDDRHWKRWTPEPGFDYLGPEHWEKAEGYVKDVVGAHISDHRVLVWDVMNEPWCPAGKAGDPDPNGETAQFVRHFCKQVKGLSPGSPITVGLTNLERTKLMEDENEVISFHSYVADSGDLQALLERANQYARDQGKPILLTEWGHPTWRAQVDSGRIMPDSEQLDYYTSIMPLVMESKIGWYIFDLIMGYGPFAHISILKTNGEKRPAAEVIEKYLKGTQAG